MSTPSLSWASLTSSLVAWCLFLPTKKLWTNLSQWYEIWLTALHRTGGARQRFHVVAIHVVGFHVFDVTWTTLSLRERASGSGESSQGGGDEDGELGEHHFGGIKVEVFGFVPSGWKGWLVFDETLGGYLPELLYEWFAHNTFCLDKVAQDCGAARRTEIIECCHAGWI